MSEISEAIKQKAAEMESENDLITIPRGLLGAALAVIKRPERSSANVVDLLSYYAYTKNAPGALRERAEPDQHEAHIRREVNAGGNTWIQCSKQAFEREKARGALCRVLYESPRAPVVPEWTNQQCLEFLAVAFRHAEIKGDFELDDLRLGVKMANAMTTGKEG
ncbi:hypothetical protein HIK14_21200 [Cronobacter sakazakii]|nr:hypothetical protein [Cronobacter sakazakii]